MLRIVTDERRSPGAKAARRFAVVRRRPPAASVGWPGQQSPVCTALLAGGLLRTITTIAGSARTP